jgi:hypothetical protein
MGYTSDSRIELDPSDTGGRETEQRSKLHRTDAVVTLSAVFLLYAQMVLLPEYLV